MGYRVLNPFRVHATPRRDCLLGPLDVVLDRGFGVAGGLRGQQLGRPQRPPAPYRPQAFHHPVVGDLHLNFEVMELPADPGLSLLAFSADAGSPDDDALNLLASWVATHDPTGAPRAPTQT